jgi:hypothetical protein
LACNQQGTREKELFRVPGLRIAIRAKLTRIGIGTGKTQSLIENPINRCLIHSLMLPAMKKNSYGSLTLYIQKDSPGVDKESNWLPAPNGPIYMVMRLYWPKAHPPSILPPGEGTWKPPGIVEVK